MAQTSVDFLWRWWMDNPFASYEEGVEAYREAKEKHKEETMDAFMAGLWDGYENKVCGAKQFKDPAEYYNETFNK